VRAPLLFAAVVASTLVASSPAHAQVRVAQPRVAVAAPVHRTVFVGGYYYPTLYRTSLAYGGWGYPYYYGGGCCYPAFYAGWGYPGYWGPAFYGQFPIYGPYHYDNSGSVRLQVQPRVAEVFVDGYYAGTVDEYDGVFQRLNVEPGEHEVQVYLDGYRPFQQRVYLQPGKTFSIKHTLEPLAPGEAAPPRPVVTGAPAARYHNGSGAVGGPGGPDANGPAAGPEAGRGARGNGPGRGRQGGAAEGFGSLSLRVQPADADVLIDGEPWKGSMDNEPLLVQLGVGTHHVEIRKEGYRSYLTDIAVGNGQVRTLNVSLTKQ
jgi:PEGA domain-containing protein